MVVLLSLCTVGVTEPCKPAVFCLSISYVSDYSVEKCKHCRSIVTSVIRGKILRSGHGHVLCFMLCVMCTGMH